MASLKFAMNADGRLADNVRDGVYLDAGWSYFDTRPERDAAARQLLEPQRRRKAAELKTRHRAVMAGGFDHDGRTWGVTQDAVVNLAIPLLMVANGKGLPGGSATVTLQDIAGNAVSLSEQELKDLGEAGSAFYFAALARQHTLSAEIAAAQTIAELDAVDIDAGWPS